MKRAFAIVACAAFLGGTPVNAGNDNKDLFHATRNKTLWTKYSKAMELLLKKGEMAFIDLHPGDVPWMVTAGVIIDAPPEKVYAIITDFSKYTEFMPQLEKVKRSDPGDGLPEITYTLGFRFAYIIPLTFSYTMKYFPRPPLRIDWVGIRDGVTSQCGYWELVPLNGGKRTAAFHTAYSTPQWSMFNKIVEKNPQLLIASVLSTALIVGQKIKERAEGDHPLLPEDGGTLTEQEVKQSGLGDLASKGIFLVIEEPDTRGRKFVTGGTLVRGSPRKMWDSITDLEAPAVMFPEVQKATLVGDDRGAQLVKLDLKINFILFSRKHSYVLRNVLDEPRKLSQSWVDGDAKDNSSTWDLFPVDGGEETLAVYRFYSDIKSSSFIARYIIKRQPAFEMAFQGSWVSTVVKGFKAWTEMSREEKEEARRTKRMKVSHEHTPAIPGY